MKKIVVAGSCILDKLYQIDNYPDRGELTQIRDISYSVGGLVPNVSIDLKRFREDIPVFASAKVGKDADGEYIINVLNKNGVNTDKIVCDKDNTTSFSIVASEIGNQRTFFVYSGASDEFSFNDIPFDILEKGDMLHLGYFLLLGKIDSGEGQKILKKAKEMGVETSIDLVSESSDRYGLVLPCLKYVDNLIVNEIEAGKLVGMDLKIKDLEVACKKLLSLGVNKRVIIHTAQVGVIYDGREFNYLPSYDLPKDFVKGTTGAGDAYCAGALVGIYDNKDAKEILQTASYSATCNLTAVDSVSGARKVKEAIKLCDKLKRRDICL